MAEIVLRNVCKNYGRVQAVRSVSFACRDREFFAILGPSGAGKTSILRMIAGVERVSSGEILVGGRSMQGVEPEDRNVAMVFENYALYPHLTVQENLAFPLRARGMPSRLVAERVERIAGLLQIKELLLQKPGQLSGGQRQRVALGRSIIREAEAYLLDEPLSHLDAKLRHRMRGELMKMCRALDATIIYVTHDYREALAMADRIAILKGGELQQVGTPAEIYGKPANEFVADFVGEPPMNLIDCELGLSGRDVVLRFQGVALTIAGGEALLERCRRIGPRGRLGVRTRHIRVFSEPQAAGAIPAKVYVVEPLGHEALLTVKVGVELLQVTVPPAFDIRVDETVWLAFDPERLHLFPPRGQEGQLAWRV